jgi:dihydroneopterin aldolase
MEEKSKKEKVDSIEELAERLAEILIEQIEEEQAQNKIKK